jgi:lambda family phage portal protein
MRRASEPTLNESFAELRSDYNAARSSRFRRRRTGVSPMGSGADYHYRSEADYLRMMEQARDMDRNDAIAGPVLDRAKLNAIQDGFTLDVDTGDEVLDEELAARWQAWCEDPDECDLAGEFTFYDLEQLIYRSALLDGDCFVLPQKEGSLQVVEAHRCRTPKRTERNVVHGVLLDANRRRKQYWFTKDDIDPLAPLVKVSDIVAYEARSRDGQKQVLHVADPRRLTQTRGITAFAPIFDALAMIEDINFAKLVQQQVVSCFAIFRQLEIDFKGSAREQRGPVDSTSTHADGASRRLEGIGPGMEIVGRPGEKLQGFSPAVPNAEYFDHVKLILTLVGVNLGLPLILVTLDASETNFSGWRGAFDQAKLGFRRNQKWLVSRFHRPVYRWKVRQWGADDPAIAAAAERDGIDIFGHRWNSPTWPYIEPLSDSQANLLRERSGQISPRRLQGESGREFKQIAKETVDDNAYRIGLAIEAANKLNAGNSDKEQKVHWRELVSLPTPEGVQIALSPTQPKPAGDGPPGAKKKPGAKDAK